MHVEHVRWSGIFRALAESEQFTQAFSRIFRDTQGYWCVFSHTHRRTTRKGEGGDWFATIWKSKKSPDFWGESPEDLGEKTQKCSLERLFLIVFRRNVYLSDLLPRNCPCSEKFLVARLHSGIILFAKRSILNVWQCSE